MIDCAIIGSGNIGTDLMYKIRRRGRHLNLVAVAGIDAASEGLALARAEGVATTHQGLDGLLAMEGFSRVRVLFDATSAKSHVEHAERLRGRGITLVDLTPAAIGPFTVPVVNLATLQNLDNINMVTCGGQATIPMVYAVSRVAKVRYAEIVASISSRSAGPGTRANIDEFTETTAHALETVGGAERGKAIIVLNPAEPPVLMRDTVVTLSEPASTADIARSVADMVAAVQAYVPGYRLKQEVQFERIDNAPVRIPGMGLVGGLKTTVFLEVEGAAQYLPAYAGNLDIMTSAAQAVGEQVALRLQERAA